MEWRAALQVLNLDDEWRQTEVIGQKLDEVRQSMAGGKGAQPLKDYHPDLLAFRSPDSTPSPGKYLTVEQMHAEAARAAGL